MQKSMIEIIWTIAEKFESGEMAKWQRESRCSDLRRWAMSMMEIAMDYPRRPFETTDVTDDFVKDTWAAYQKICMIEMPRRGAV